MSMVSQDSNSGNTDTRAVIRLIGWLGLIFLGGQFWEFSHFVREGLGLTTNLFGSTFYVLTGTHGAHVTVGVIWLLTLWVQVP